jgi:tRNA pseudouridine32 synthase/23S rRNA pseudouridine746 synthase
MVLARGAEMNSILSKQFIAKQVKKTYLALVWGQMKDDADIIDLPLAKDWPNRPKQKICYETGKQAITRYKVLERLTHSTRIALYPETGRTHQLRMHTLHIGHPILGDELYAPDDAYNAAPRLMLHAHEISFAHPVSGEDMHFAADTCF